MVFSSVRQGIYETPLGLAYMTAMAGIVKIEDREIQYGKRLLLAARVCALRV